MHDQHHEEREATDQPPPIQAPLTRGQIRSLVLPGLGLLLLCAVLLWGTLASVRHAPAAGTAAGTPAPAAATDSPAANATGGDAAPAGSAPPLPALATLAPTAPATASPLPTLAALALSVPATAPPLPTLAALALSAPPTAPLPFPATATVAAPPSPSPAPGLIPTAVLSPAALPTSTAALPSPTGSATLTAGGSVADPSAPLRGRRIGLDPGHGPRGDLGAILVDPDTGRLILAEDELNLDVALRTRALLQARGATVIMTRVTKDSFTAPWPPDTNGDGIAHGEADDLQERIDILNAGRAEVFLSIHANSSANPAKRQGIQALYCASADCLFPAQNKRLGLLALDALQQQLAAAGYPITARELRNDVWSDTPGEAPGHLYMLGPADPPHHPRAAQMPGVVVESLYVTSPEEAAELKLDSVRQAIAQAYANALQQFLTGAAP